MESSNTFSWVFSVNETGGEAMVDIQLVGVAVGAAWIKLHTNNHMLIHKHSKVRTDITLNEAFTELCSFIFILSDHLKLKLDDTTFVFMPNYDERAKLCFTTLSTWQQHLLLKYQFCLICKYICSIWSSLVIQVIFFFFPSCLVYVQLWEKHKLFCFPWQHPEYLPSLSMLIRHNENF